MHPPAADVHVFDRQNFNHTAQSHGFHPHGTWKLEETPYSTDGRENHSQPDMAQLDMAQLDMAQLDLAQFDLAQFDPSFFPEERTEHSPGRHRRPETLDSKALDSRTLLVRSHELPSEEGHAGPVFLKAPTKDGFPQKSLGNDAARGAASGKTDHAYLELGRQTFKRPPRCVPPAIRPKTT